MKKRHSIEQPVTRIEKTESENHQDLLAENVYDLPCSNTHCPDRIETPSFPSPTSCLSKERLHELEEKIESANRLLLDLGLSDQQSEHGKRVLLDGLMGKMVKIKVHSYEQEKETDNNHLQESKTEQLENIIEIDIKKRKLGRKGNRIKSKKKRIQKKHIRLKRKVQTRPDDSHFVSGLVHLVGRDFVELRKNEVRLLIPLRKICLVITQTHYKAAADEPALLDIDSCLRRNLTQHFGETVANDARLVQLFFRIPLSMYLKGLINVRLTFYTGDGRSSGVLKRIEEDKIFYESSSGHLNTLKIDSICYIMK